MSRGGIEGVWVGSKLGHNTNRSRKQGELRGPSPPATQTKDHPRADREGGRPPARMLICNPQPSER